MVALTRTLDVKGNGQSRIRTLSSLIAAVCLLLVACGPETDVERTSLDSSETLGVLRAPITQGADDDGDDAIVAVMASIPSPELVCTGTLISPKVVLTAAHCLNDLDPTSLQIAFGTNARRATSSWTVSARVVHPDYRRERLAEHDLAALVLERAVPGTPVPVALETMDASTIGAPLRLVGFGVTSADDDAMGRKQTGVARVDEVGNTRFRAAPAPSLTCFHDSGAPALLSRGGIEELAGVTTSGDSDCVVFSRFTRVDRYVDGFIRPIVEAAGGLSEAGTGPETTPFGQGCQTGHGAARMPGWISVLLLAALGTLSRRRTR